MTHPAACHTRADVVLILKKCHDLAAILRPGRFLGLFSEILEVLRIFHSRRERFHGELLFYIAFIRFPPKLSTSHSGSRFMMRDSVAYPEWISVMVVLSKFKNSAGLNEYSLRR